MLRLLFWRRAVSLRNTIWAFSRWEWIRNTAFSSAGLGLLFGLYCGFYRLLAYLNGVELIGTLLIWKLTAMAMLTTFSMAAISSLLTSLSTLYFSYDLKFLVKAPLPMETVFIDKSLESLFFCSWMIGLVLVPYIAALARVGGYGAGFYAAFFFLMGPFLILAGCIGMTFTLLVLYFFPSSKTRDVIWVFSSLSLTFVYGLIRFSEPERLIRPDALHIIADYLKFLQAPTAPYVPSWWLTEALSSLAAGNMDLFWKDAVLLLLTAAGVYGGMVLLARKVYFSGYSGAQEGHLRRVDTTVRELPEKRWGGPLGLRGVMAPLFWKERKGFFRDVKHWSQILLILGLIFVYLYSIKRLPLDSVDLRSLVSFLNIGVAGFVIAALGLRFTYPAISLEGRSWWVLKAAPIRIGDLMGQKFIFSAIPMTLVALSLCAIANVLLDADLFTSSISLASMLIMTWVVCAMGIGFGALFPMFTVENIHQIESSMGGFVYMAASLGYIGLTVMLLSWPMQMHFQERFGKVGAWDYDILGWCVGTLVVVNAAALAVPWILGKRSLETYEG